MCYVPNIKITIKIRIILLLLYPDAAISEIAFGKTTRPAKRRLFVSRSTKVKRKGRLALNVCGADDIIKGTTDMAKTQLINNNYKLVVTYF